MKQQQRTSKLQIERFILKHSNKDGFCRHWNTHTLVIHTHSLTVSTLAVSYSRRCRWTLLQSWRKWLNPEYWRRCSAAKTTRFKILKPRCLFLNICRDGSRSGEHSPKTGLRQWLAPNPCVSSRLSASTSMDTTWWPGIMARPKTLGSPWENVSKEEKTRKTIITGWHKEVNGEGCKNTCSPPPRRALKWSPAFTYLWTWGIPELSPGWHCSPGPCRGKAPPESVRLSYGSSCSCSGAPPVCAWPETMRTHQTAPGWRFKK